jgi:hypothetical protein
LPVSASVRFSSFQDSNSGPSAGVTEVPQTACFFELFRPEDRNPDRRGVALQSVSPAQSRDLSVSCPLAVSDIESFCSEDQRVTMPRSFRALLPARIRSLRPTEVECGSMLSWAFSSHRVLVLRWRPSRLPDSPRRSDDHRARRLRRSRFPESFRMADPTPPCGFVADFLRHP